MMRQNVEANPNRPKKDNLQPQPPKREHSAVGPMEEEAGEAAASESNMGASAGDSSVDEYAELTDALAIDCEMVGAGKRGRISMLARVSVVNEYGVVLMDKYVKPWKVVVDYRTKYSGIREEDLKHGEDFGHVRKQVQEMLKGRILVGHALRNDLSALNITHPRALTRDTSSYRFFCNKSEGQTPSLKKLSMKFLGIKIQQGEHDSVEDAQAAMSLYMLYRKQWDSKRKKKKSGAKEYYKYEPRKERRRTNVASTSYLDQVNKLSKLPSFETRFDKNVEIVTIHSNQQKSVKEKEEEKVYCERSELKKGQSTKDLSTLRSNVIQTGMTSGGSSRSTPKQQEERFDRNIEIVTIHSNQQKSVKEKEEEKAIFERYKN